MDYPTIQDVARAANVSTATVSRALSAPDRVSEPTRQRVYEAVERTGYAVNQTARNLRRRRTGAIVVLVPNLGNPFFSRILAGIEAARQRAASWARGATADGRLRSSLANGAKPEGSRRCASTMPAAPNWPSTTSPRSATGRSAMCSARWRTC